jgi:hypothetical protein
MSEIMNEEKKELRVRCIKIYLPSEFLCPNEKQLEHIRNYKGFDYEKAYDEKICEECFWNLVGT